MTQSLSQRYHYGNSAWPNPFTPEAELIYETPRREIEMIHLAKQQIKAQNDAGREIAKSNLIGAQVIAKEIELQTLALESTINQVGGRITESVALAANQISDAIEILGDRICIELSEIKWQLTQQNVTLENILATLQETRNNEAKQLVKQGLRHYVNAEFEEAEDRLKLALSFDTTDYQVLMNLAFIEIHKDNSSQALNYFLKALSLPENLDSSSKARTLWALARLYYAKEDFNKAYAHAKEAFKYDDNSDPAILYSFAVYETLIGEKSCALIKIEQSILKNPSYFTRCSVDPDLKSIKGDILELLGKLSSDAESAAKQKVNTMASEFSVLKKNGKSYSNDSFIQEINKIINMSIDKLKNPSYSFCLRCINNMNTLQKVFTNLKDLKSLDADLEKKQVDFATKEKSYNTLQQKSTPEKDLPSLVEGIMPFYSYLLPGILAANAFMSYEPVKNAGGGKIIYFILTVLGWPLAFIASFFSGILSGNEAMANVFKGCIAGLVIVLITHTILSFIRKEMSKNYDNHIKDLSDIRQRYNDAEKSLKTTQEEISQKQKTIKLQLSNTSWV